MERVGPEGMLDVVAEQLLVLLLMMDAQLDALGRLGRHTALIELCDGIVHVPAIGEDSIDTGAREEGASFLLRLIGDVVVITVEEPEEVRIAGLIAGEVFAENECFEEPGGVGQMPFGGAGLGTALHHHVFRRKWGAEGETLASRRGECGQESGRAEFNC